MSEVKATELPSSTYFYRGKEGSMTSFVYGKVCKRHPELNGRRYAASRGCPQCQKELQIGLREKKEVSAQQQLINLQAKLAKAEKAAAYWKWFISQDWSLQAVQNFTGLDFDFSDELEKYISELK